VALADPGALTLGLRRAALALGVRLYERTPVQRATAAEQRAAVGWARGQGIADRGNRLHYYRLTPDGRILSAATRRSTGSATASTTPA
jgi:hypothetical protein